MHRRASAVRLFHRSQGTARSWRCSRYGKTLIFTIAPPLANLSSLRDLSFVGCNEVKDLGFLSRLPHLHKLRLDVGTDKEGYSPLSSLNELRALRIFSWSALRDVAFVAKMPHLQSLDVSCAGAKALGSLASAKPGRTARPLFRFLGFDVAGRPAELDVAEGLGVARQARPLARGSAAHWRRYRCSKRSTTSRRLDA